MIAADTTVVVAAFSSWHVAHEAAKSALDLDIDTRLPAHALLESYSVLTRLPQPHRAAPRAVSEFLFERFRRPPLTLTARGHLDLVRQTASLELPGGMIYDALIAATAREAEAALLTRDRRAIPVYELLGVAYRFVE